MWSKLRDWSNRKQVRQQRLPTVSSRTWTRRIQMLVSPDSDQVKLKLEDGNVYREVLVPEGLVDVIWDRFKAGQSIDDALSIFYSQVPASQQSRKARQEGSA